MSDHQGAPGMGLRPAKIVASIGTARLCIVTDRLWAPHIVHGVSDVQQRSSGVTGVKWRNMHKLNSAND